MAAKRNARRQPPSWSERLAAARTRVFALLPNAVVLAIAAILTSSAALALTAMQRVSVERVVVLGKLAHVQEAALREVLASELDAGLLFLNLGELRERLEALPWVYSAELRRRYPETLEVHVVEQLPIARWGNNGFLNHEAKIIEVSNADRWRDLPLISGPEGHAASLVSTYLQLREQLLAVSLAPVSLAEDEFGQLFVRLDRGTILALGSRSHSDRMDRFLTLWRTELGSRPQRAIARVDLRYSEGAAVEFAEQPKLLGVASLDLGGVDE
ncbi:MAG: FtsQ-type POTRA domain-containing protein [Pseudomonadota bacterium]